MAFRALAGALAVIVIPIAALGADRPPASGGESEKKVCEVTGMIGTRLSNVRRCRTKAEREEAQREARRVVDRIQSMRPTTCPPAPRPC